MVVITVAIHELGHAVAAYLLVKQKVVLFLGSYGDEQNSIKITSGQFEVWVRQNPLKWKGGLCRPTKGGFTSRQSFIFILGGPLASLLLFLILVSYFGAFHPEGTKGAFFLMWCIWSGLVFLYNMIPKNDAISLHQGHMTYNDGTQLYILWKNKHRTPEYEAALDHYKGKRYAQAAAIFEDLLKTQKKDADLYRASVSTYIELKEYQKATEIQKEQVQTIGNLNNIDRMYMALLKTFTGDTEEAIKYYKHLLSTGGNNKFNLNNLGYTLTLVNKFEESIPYLDKALVIDKDFGQAYCGRAYAKMMLGDLEGGKADNDIAMRIDKDNAYTYCNSGIYLFEKGRFVEAMPEFLRAKELDKTIPYLNNYLFLVEQRLKRVG